VKQVKVILILSLGASLFKGFDSPQAQDRTWKEIDAGLSIGEFDSPQKSWMGDSKITVVRTAPRYYSFRLLSASEFENSRMTAKEWCKQHALISAVNAGMFQSDGITSVGYMKNFNHLNNPKLNRENAFFVFNPIDFSVPEVQIIDRKCQDFDQLWKKYQTIVQSIRMVSCRQTNVWSQQPRKWSVVAIGMARSGDVLFIFTRSPYSVHDFVSILLSLPLAIYSAIYLEGGPEASLYFSVKGVEIDKFGSYETSFNENDENSKAWPIANVIGIIKKPEK